MQEKLEKLNVDNLQKKNRNVQVEILSVESFLSSCNFLYYVFYNFHTIVG